MFKKVFSTISILSLFLISFSLFQTSPKVYAAADTCTWTGAVNGNWSNGGNWAGCDNGNVPESGDDLIFPNVAANATNTNDLVGMTFATINFDNAYTISGNSFSIGGGIYAAGPASISNAITLTANQTFQTTGAATITFTGNLDLNGNNLTMDVQGDILDFNNVISGAGDILKLSNGEVQISGNNTFTGNFVVSAGRVSLYNNNGLGSTAGSTTVNSGSTVFIYTSNSIPENFNIAGTGSSGGGAISTLVDATIAGNIALNASTRIRSGSGFTLTINGVISGAGASDLELRGTMILNGNNTYSGDTIIDGAFSPVPDITFNGNQPNSLIDANNATIRGTGTIGNLTGSGTSTIFPRTSASVGTLNTGNLVFTNSSQSITFDINNTTNDQLNTTGTVTLNGAAISLNIINPATVEGQVYTILNNDGADVVSGTFVGYPEGTTFVSGGINYTISYLGGTGNDITFTATNVPLAPANIAPVNNVPGTQNTPMNTNLTFNVGNSNLISISDADAASGAMEVTLNSTNGTFSLSGITNLAFTVGDGTDDSSMVFTGTLAEINTALNGLVFTPTNNFTGVGSIQITTNDQGNTGSGGPLSDTDTININIGSVTLSSTGGNINYSILLGLVLISLMGLGVLLIKNNSKTSKN